MIADAADGRATIDRDASIVLLGLRGSGKTSLALITQASLGFRHIEADEVFQRETGVSAVQYRKDHGVEQSRIRWVAVLSQLLNTSPKHCVIVWPKDYYVEEAGLSLLQQYSQTHPIILVQRDAVAVQKYLQLPEGSKVEKLSQLMTATLRSCSNYEYYNLEEGHTVNQNGDASDDASSSDIAYYAPRTLRMKRVEESFLRLVRNILQQNSGFTEGSYIPQSRAIYTYMLNVSLVQVSSDGFNTGWLNCGADAIQLEIPSDNSVFQTSLATQKETISRAVICLTRAFNGPVIYHVTAPSDGSPASSQARYRDVLEHGFRLGVELATIDLKLPRLELEDLIRRSRGTKLIADFHDSAPEPNGWASGQRRDMLNKALSLETHGIRLTQPALCSSDNREAAGFLINAKGRSQSAFISAYNTGHLGRTSRCFNETLTPVTTEELRAHSLDSHAKHEPQPEITIRQSQASIYASFVYDPMKYYIIGQDVSYSYSPVIHAAAHDFFGMPHRLETKSMASLDELASISNDSHFGGLTIAQPYKTAILSRVSAMSTHARNIGAINTLLPIRRAFDYSMPPPAEFWADRNRAGPVLAFYGDNADWIGMMRCIKQNLSPANVISPRTTAVVIGAGGMARAAIYALLNLGVRHIALYNRTNEKAHGLADHFSKIELDISTDLMTGQSHSGVVPATTAARDIRVLDSLVSNWYEDLASPTIFLSCIPPPEPSQSPQARFLLPSQWMKSPTGGVVIEMSYRVLLTPLLRQVHAQVHRGWVGVNGLQNLCEQASAQFEIFTSRKVPRNLMCIAALYHYLDRNKDDVEGCRYIQGKLQTLLSKT
jgi:shikimate 5-dehydrogenase/shikimate kinase